MVCHFMESFHLGWWNYTTDRNQTECSKQVAGQSWSMIPVLLYKFKAFFPSTVAPWSSHVAVDGRNPAPVEICKTLWILGYLPCQLVQDFFHQPYFLKIFWTYHCHPFTVQQIRRNQRLSVDSRNTIPSGLYLENPELAMIWITRWWQLKYLFIFTPT